MLRVIFTSVAMLTLGGCGIPQSAVLTFAAEAPRSSNLRDIPEDWKGRLIRSRAIAEPTLTGGSAAHVHQLAHQHRTQSLPTTNLAGPLGVRNVTADATHRHLVESIETTPANTQPADHMPPAYGLDAVVATRTIGRPMPGLVVGYLGDRLPDGWFWCDGENGTPDLRSRFILLDGPNGPSGASEHSHDAPHSHRWATADNEDRPGYFGDPATPIEPIVNAASRVHRHAPQTGGMDRGVTSAAPNDPPAVGMRFIYAGPLARKFPNGMVIAFAGRGVPSGWRPVEQRLSGQIVGRFWKVVGAEGDLIRLSGSASHSHTLRSTHEFELASNDGSAGRDRTGQGPPVPVAGHRHQVVINEETPTAAAEAMPRYVSLLLIEKH